MPRRSASLISNPASGQRGRYRRPEVEAALLANGYRLETRETRGPGDATRLAREAAEDGAECVFALGGDGTLREIAAGLLGTDTAMAPLPAGTTDVVAQAFGLPRDPLEALGALEAGCVRQIDVGLCGGEPFLMQASAGLDARVLARLSPALKRRLGKPAVALAALREWWRYESPGIEVTVGGERRQAGFVAACNLPFYAGRFRLAPAAEPDDGRLELVLFHGRGRRAMLSFAWDLARRRHVERADVEVTGVESVVLDGSAELDVQLDGDALRQPLPVEIRLAARRLSILVPEVSHGRASTPPGS